ncbi:hypothetical protein X975_13177, partial [Stegodyphus mimosarum]
MLMVSRKILFPFTYLYMDHWLLQTVYLHYFEHSYLLKLVFKLLYSFMID